MRLRRNKEDPATRKLEEEGLLRLHSEKKSRINTEKIREFGRVTYDFWSGVKYMIVLSSLLWWIPLFGPMIAGYVGGRRTGGPKKGLVASIVSLGVIGVVYYVLVEGFLPVTLGSILSYPTGMISAAEAHSFLGPYFEFLTLYWSTFFGRVVDSVPFETNSYLITIIFAYIGGIISAEKRKEYADGMRKAGGAQSGTTTTIRMKYPKRQVAAPNNASAASQRRLQDLKPVRFKDDGRRRKDKKSDRESKRLKEKSSSRFEDKRALDGGNKTSRSRSVEHHSRSSGNDWELL
ncbi:MAG: hypothetical protein ACLFNY_00535 [Candidatus Aenigmatarchaeota archaeon]